MTDQPTTRPAQTQRQRRGHDFYPPVASAIPALYGTEDTPTREKVLHAHYFAAACDWWIAEYDPATGEAFGYACLGDLHWTPTRAADAALPGRYAR
jgi:hypothetical protein